MIESIGEMKMLGCRMNNQLLKVAITELFKYSTPAFDNLLKRTYTLVHLPNRSERSHRGAPLFCNLIDCIKESLLS
jgi:hypothetical protein